MKTFPLKKQIVFSRASDRVPRYLTEESQVMDISQKNATATVEVSEIEDMLSRSSLDPSQQAALAHALTHRLAIIQGPPGCGKTYVGIQLVKLLLSMSPAPRTPILVLTYKNHALDEFLKGLLEFVGLEGIVRVGGRSQEVELDSCNIKNMERKSKDYLMLDQINSLKDEIKSKNEEVKQKMLALQDGSQLTIQDLLEAWTEDQVRNFLLTAPYGKTSVCVSFGKKGFANRQNVETLMASIHSVHDTLLNCFINERYENSAEQQLCQLFEKVLEFWVPNSVCFSQLKQLQTQFVGQLRAAQEFHNQALQEDEDTEPDLCDEEVIESIMEARLAAQGRSSKGSDKQEAKRKITVFSQDKKLGRVAHFQDFPPNMEENRQLLSSVNFWDFNTVSKIALLFTVLSQKMEEYSAGLTDEMEELNLMTQSLDELKAQMKAGLLHSKKVIGMTITGASINHQFIQEVSPAIVIVEEAAEVLEADLLAALTPGLQHLVLIGDHKQLRPNVDTYKLKKDYHFDVSMMERLIHNNFPFKTLRLQNRMRPEFSQLLRDIYPDLQDNLARVSSHKPADGLVKSMIFWNHNKLEKRGRSCTNTEECRRAVLLAVYLMSTGIKASQITILAAYQGQVSEIRSMMNTHGGTSTPSKQPEQRVHVSTIDMFQGDENDFIIVSLVRSNGNGAIGFLAEESRRCVAQSRARCGMFLIGSEATMTHRAGSTWISLLNSMRKGGWVSNTLAVQCVKHKEASVVNICDADAFEKLIQQPGSLCKLACGVLYACGLHKCTKPCLPNHAHASCMIMVSFTHTTCGHTGEKRCHEDSKSVSCGKPVLLEFVSCGHKVIVKCIQKQEHDTGRKIKKCTTEVDCVLPACGHTITKPCHANLLHIVCKSVVYYTGACGHDLSRECHLAPDQVQCEFRPCATLRSCGHPCVNKCGQPCDMGDCKACKLEYEHRRKKNQHRAKVRVKMLEKQIKEAGGAFCRKELQVGDPEYLVVYDRVTKYVLPMHNWYPQITKVEKVQNPKLEIKYEEFRAKAFGDHEDLKFHGTDDAGVEGISKNGFRLGKDGMYGAGIYFATDSSKSSQNIYTKGSNKLLLCKVFLGRAKTVDKADKSLTGPKLRREGYDSVFAPRGTKESGGVLNDEFVVFEPSQAFVQYVIHYDSLPFGLPNIMTTASSPIKAFRKVLMKPGRTVDLKDPLEASYRFAEGHFHRMMLKYSTGRRQNTQMGISAITVVVNPTLAAKFEEKQKRFNVQNKGKELNK